MVGHPPFETKSLRETYSRIRNNEYTIPSRISDNAAKLIKKMLQPNPTDRPSLNEILEDDFFTKGFHPNRLPASSVTASPRWSDYDKSEESEKKISKEAIKQITIALSRQMRLAGDEKEESMDTDCCVTEENGEYIGKEVSPCQKDSGLGEISESSCVQRHTGQGGGYYLFAGQSLCYLDTKHQARLSLNSDPFSAKEKSALCLLFKPVFVYALLIIHIKKGKGKETLSMTVTI